MILLTHLDLTGTLDLLACSKSHRKKEFPKIRTRFKTLVKRLHHQEFLNKPSIPCESYFEATRLRFFPTKGIVTNPLFFVERGAKA